jgi:protein-disulfide isomerase
MLRGYGGDVRFVFREYPLSMHPHAKRAARAALAAYEQGRFWPYADRLFHNQHELEEKALRGYAAEAGLNVGRALAGEAAAAALVRDVRERHRYRVRGTPTYFVDGIRVRAYGEAGLRQAIERALAERPRGQKERDWRR